MIDFCLGNFHVALGSYGSFATDDTGHACRSMPASRQKRPKWRASRNGAAGSNTDGGARVLIVEDGGRRHISGLHDCSRQPI